MIYIVFDYTNTLSFILCQRKECKRMPFEMLLLIGAQENSCNRQQNWPESEEAKTHIPLFFTDETKHESRQMDEEEDFNVLAFEDLLCFSYQVAKGMEFLESKSVWQRVAKCFDWNYGKNTSVCKRQTEEQRHTLACLNCTSLPIFMARTGLQYYTWPSGRSGCILLPTLALP